MGNALHKLSPAAKPHSSSGLRLSSLPPEILSLIINELASGAKADAMSSLADVLAISMCCYTLRKLCLPSLFRTVHPAKTPEKFAAFVDDLLPRGYGAHVRALIGIDLSRAAIADDAVYARVVEACGGLTDLELIIDSDTDTSFPKTLISISQLHRLRSLGMQGRKRGAVGSGKAPSISSGVLAHHAVTLNELKLSRVLLNQTAVEGIVSLRDLGSLRLDDVSLADDVPSDFETPHLSLRELVVTGTGLSAISNLVVPLLCSSAPSLRSLHLATEDDVDTWCIDPFVSRLNGALSGKPPLALDRLEIHACDYWGVGEIIDLLLPTGGGAAEGSGRREAGFCFETCSCVWSSNAEGETARRR